MGARQWWQEVFSVCCVEKETMVTRQSRCMLKVPLVLAVGIRVVTGSLLCLSCGEQGHGDWIIW